MNVTYLTNRIDLQSIHSNPGIIDLQLTIACIYHKHDPIHCKTNIQTHTNKLSLLNNNLLLCMTLRNPSASIPSNQSHDTHQLEKSLLCQWPQHTCEHLQEIFEIFWPVSLRVAVSRLAIPTKEEHHPALIAALSTNKQTNKQTKTNHTKHRFICADCQLSVEVFWQILANLDNVYFYSTTCTCKTMSSKLD